MFKLHLFKKKADNSEDINEIIKQIKKNSDHALKESIIIKYKPFIVKCVSEAIGKYIELENCDEFSIGLLAFNESIDTYDHRFNRNFFNFSEQVIKRRLTTYYKLNKNKKNQIPFTSLENGKYDFEERFLKTDHNDYFSDLETKDQMSRYENELRIYGISFNDLILNGPKHKDSRHKLIEIGRILAKNNNLYKSLVRTRNIPLSELMKLVNVSQRTIERNRKFIIAVCLAYNCEFDILKEYVKCEEKGGEKYE